MSVELHVDCSVPRGRMAEFAKAAARWREYRRGRGWAVPRLLFGFSGSMNSVRMVFEYPSMEHFEQQDRTESSDSEYARVAMELPLEAEITRSIWRRD